ncbi:DUF4105 domain-containing protein [Desulfobotulus sp. H1]|uniref:DUF4105 domain-containing protein n=1 Tax=Desulfobotulus pelophilus TaxID=2823377 RepID=A0ABT3N593_9BACT|nr:DUF4105 domain-containing protein [Desulfobotulus pelophilus]MCW7752623.1 DUF4105 domain-containing protein [Desulfobotulus pelophilus]
MLQIMEKTRLWVWVVLSFMVGPPVVFAGSRVENLVQKAEELKLAEHRYWEVLYHYHRPLGLGVKSRIDDPAFFISPEGRRNPQEEMRAAIRFLFSGKAESLCPYIARYHWLYQQLLPDSAEFPEPVCPDIEGISPTSARLVFPTYFMNSPASMFGHTLMTLRLDNTSRVLDKAVNYSAFTDETNGLLFAFRGIFGLYPGYFNVLPYYKKIQEYGEINQRDIWEYRLDLEPHELDAMVRHIREMEGIYSNYYFFDENCSFTLLYLVEASRSGLRLTESFPLWVIPVDTVRTLEKAELIAEAEYRPSRATIIRHRLAHLDRKDQDLAYDILEGKEAPETVLELDAQRAIHILDTVIDCIRYRFVKRKMDQDAYQKILIRTLRVRSLLGVTGEVLPPIQEPVRPDNLHNSSRVSAGVQVHDGKSSLQLTYRPAFTDLTDPDYPESDGIRIVFGETSLRLGPEGEGVQLERLEIIDIMSLSPRNRFFSSLSWAAGLGLEGVPGEKRGRLLRVAGGAGFSWGGGSNGLWYLMGMPRFFAGTGLEEGYALGGVVRAGWVFRLFEHSKWQAFGEYGGFGAGHQGYAAAAGVEGSVRLGRNWHLGAEISHEQRWDQSTLKSLMMLHWFY